MDSRRHHKPGLLLPRNDSQRRSYRMSSDSGEEAEAEAGRQQPRRHSEVKFGRDLFSVQLEVRGIARAPYLRDTMTNKLQAPLVP